MALPLIDPIGTLEQLPSDARAIGSNNQLLRTLLRDMSASDHASGSILVWDAATDSWVAVATDGTALPASPVNGQPFLLRAGSTPFDFIALVYDSTYGKWVSAVVGVSSQNQTNFTATNTAYDAAAHTNMDWIVLPNAKTIYDAGLRPQCFVTGILDNDTVGAVTYARASIYDIAENGTGRSVIGSGAEITNTGTTQSYERSGWTEISVTVNQIDWLVIFDIKVDAASTGTYLNSCSVSFRWVSA